LITELAGTPYRSDDRLGEVAEKIAASDPAKAVEWVASLPPSPQDGHYIAIGRTMNAWGEHDAPAAEAWLNNLPPSPLRDQALIAYARYLQGSQSTAADQWLAQVQDQQLLQQQQQRAAQVTLFSTELNQVRRATFSSGGKLLIETIEPAPAPSQ
jgi:hypothetical protein